MDQFGHGMPESFPPQEEVASPLPKFPSSAVRSKSTRPGLDISQWKHFLPQPTDADRWIYDPQEPTAECLNPRGEPRRDAAMAPAWIFHH
jgi:hypothetical protein